MVEYITNELKIVIVSILIFSIISINDIEKALEKITMGIPAASLKDDAKKRLISKIEKKNWLSY